MMRVFLRLSSVLALTITLTVGAILAQPGDNAAMRAFFSPPEGCAVPCFLGIRPGVTTRAEALAILEAHPWVERINAATDNLTWSWNGRQPAFISAGGRYNISSITVREGIVTRIYLTTATRWGAFLSVFGLPDRETFLATGLMADPYIFNDAAYLDHNFQVELKLHCPLAGHTAPWYSPISITWPAPDEMLTGRVSSVASC